MIGPVSELAYRSHAKKPAQLAPDLEHNVGTKSAVRLVLAFLLSLPRPLFSAFICLLPQDGEVSSVFFFFWRRPGFIFPGRRTIPFVLFGVTCDGQHSLRTTWNVEGSWDLSRYILRK